MKTASVLLLAAVLSGCAHKRVIIPVVATAATITAVAIATHSGGSAVLKPVPRYPISGRVTR